MKSTDTRLVLIMQENVEEGGRGRGEGEEEGRDEGREGEREEKLSIFQAYTRHTVFAVFSFYP